MMKKATLLGAAVISAGALLLTGCSSASDEGADPTDGPITLEYWAWGTAQQPLVDAWNASHPDTQVTRTDAGGGTDSSAKLLTATRAGNAPDVALIEFNTLPDDHRGEGVELDERDVGCVAGARGGEE